MSGSRRDLAAPIIAKVIADTGRADEKALRLALRDAYPFGARKWHPYKIWCDEVRNQLGLKPPKPARGHVVDRLTVDMFA